MKIYPLVKQLPSVFRLYLFFLLVLTGCQTGLQVAAPTVPTLSPAINPTSSSTVPVIVEITVPIASVTVSTQPESASPTSTMAIQLTEKPEPTATSTPTKTPVPTLPAATAEAILLELLTNDVGCQLPCWWGATPGETNWSEVESLFLSLEARISVHNRSLIEIFLPHVPEEVASGDPLGLHLFYFAPEDTIEAIDVIAVHSITYRLLPILTSYGQPTEVWINSQSAPEGSPSRLVLTYPEQGFAVLLFDDAEVIGNKILSCFPVDSEWGLSLYLWNSDEEILSFQEIMQKSEFDESQYYLPLEEATEMNLEVFYQIYKEPDNPPCIQTPAEIWH